MYENWTADTVWPPTAVDFVLYAFTTIIWIFIAFQSIHLSKFYKLQEYHYFRARLPGLLVTMIIPAMLQIAFVSPSVCLIHLKIAQHQWEFPSFLRTIANVSSGSILMSGLLYIWFILYEFKFQECLFFTNIKAQFRYKSQSLTSVTYGSFAKLGLPDTESSMSDASLTVQSVSSTFPSSLKFNPENIDIVSQNTIVHSEFWHKQRKCFGNPTKVILYIIAPVFCIYTGLYYWVNEYISPKLSPTVQVSYVLIIILCIILCGKSISRYADSLYIKGYHLSFFSLPVYMYIVELYCSKRYT